MSPVIRNIPEEQVKNGIFIRAALSGISSAVSWKPKVTLTAKCS